MSPRILELNLLEKILHEANNASYSCTLMARNFRVNRMRRMKAPNVTSVLAQLYVAQKRKCRATAVPINVIARASHDSGLVIIAVLVGTVGIVPLRSFF